MPSRKLELEAQAVVNDFVVEKCDSALKATDKVMDNMEKDIVKKSQWQARWNSQIHSKFINLML